MKKISNIIGEGKQSATRLFTIHPALNFYLQLELPKILYQSKLHTLRNPMMYTSHPSLSQKKPQEASLNVYKTNREWSSGMLADNNHRSKALRKHIFGKGSTAPQTLRAATGACNKPVCSEYLETGCLANNDVRQFATDPRDPACKHPLLTSNICSLMQCVWLAVG